MNEYDEIENTLHRLYSRTLSFHLVPWPIVNERLQSRIDWYTSHADKVRSTTVESLRQILSLKGETDEQQKRDTSPQQTDFSSFPLSPTDCGDTTAPQAPEDTQTPGTDTTPDTKLL
jgi:hypothetical protein